MWKSKNWRWISVQLLDTGNRGITVPNTAESLLVAEVKVRQFENPSLVKLRGSIPFQKKQRSGYPRMGPLDTKTGYVYLISEDSKRRSWQRLTNPGITFIRGQPRRTTFFDNYTGWKHEEVHCWVRHSCPNFPQVKFEHQKSGGLLRYMEIVT